MRVHATAEAPGRAATGRVVCRSGEKQDQKDVHVKTAAMPWDDKHDESEVVKQWKAAMHRGLNPW